VDAAPVFAYAFETLPDADRIFLAEQLVKYSTPECIMALQDPDASLREAAEKALQDAAAKQ